MLSKRTVLYLAYSFFQDFVLVYPVYVILFLDAGLSYVRIALLMAIWTGTVLLLEIPSGILADVWSRKAMLALGMSLKAAGFLVWLIEPGFSGFALGFVFWGVQEAFCSGTTEALLYDSLRHEGREELFETAAGAGAFASRVAIASAMILGGMLHGESPEAVLLFSSAATLLAALAVTFFPEPRAPSRQDRTGGAPVRRRFSELAKLTREMLAEPGMIAFLLFGALVSASHGVLDEYDTAFGHYRGVPVRLVGLWGAFRFGLEGIGGLLAPLLAVRVKLRRPERLAFWAVLSGSVLFVGVLSSRLLPFYFLFYLIIVPFEIVYQGNLQRRIASAGRATFSSVASLLYELFGLVLVLALGPVADARGLPAMFLAGAALIVTAGIAYRLVRGMDGTSAR